MKRVTCLASLSLALITTAAAQQFIYWLQFELNARIPPQPRFSTQEIQGDNMNTQASVVGTPMSEQTLVTSIFGTVTSKRVIYNGSRGQDRNRATSWPWHRQQAAEFVEAIRQQIVQR